MHTLAVSFVIRLDLIQEHTLVTVTLGGEVEQGRVNDAARVGQSADLVTAPLFLLRFCLSQLLLFSWRMFFL